jgi:hypothetical protein
MKPIYKKILKELEKGNAVQLQVEEKDKLCDYNARFRLVTPLTCLFGYVMSFSWSSKKLNTSCFLSKGLLKYTPKEQLPIYIVARMEQYDRMCGLKIKNIQVLK